MLLIVKSSSASSLCLQCDAFTANVSKHTPYILFVAATYLEYGRKLLLHVKETVWVLYAVYKSTRSSKSATNIAMVEISPSQPYSTLLYSGRQ